MCEFTRQIKANDQSRRSRSCISAPIGRLVLLKESSMKLRQVRGGGSEGYFQTVMLLKISGYGSDVAEGGESFDTFNQTAKTKKREKEIRQLPSTELKTFCL